VQENEGTGDGGGRPTPELEPETTEPELDRETEVALVSRIVDGDQDAFAVLLDRFQGRVFRMVRRMWSRDKQLVEDLTQEVFLRVYRGLARFQGDCALATWIHRIAVNVCISELRQRKAMKRDKPTVSIDRPLRGDDGDDALYLEPTVEARSPAEALERQELYSACRAAIDDLPELWKVILTLRDIEGRSYEEIAEILDLPIGTVRSRLHRARARVRRQLDGPPEERGA
jgi:RNA polymerase sigma-70 factor (ECF subfamily)